MAEYEKLQKDIHDLVVSYSFTPVTGKPTWEDREHFEEERIEDLPSHVVEFADPEC